MHAVVRRDGKKISVDGTRVGLSSKVVRRDTKMCVGEGIVR